MKAQEMKFRSFGSGCRFDEDGLRLIQSDSELQKILSVVHYHEGAQTLHAIVKGIVSPQSPNGVASSLLRRCRDFVRSCESCQMCRRMSGIKHSRALRQLESRELARKPIRISIHGEEVKLSPAEATELRKQLQQEDEASRQALILRFPRAEAPFEQIHMDIVGPWQIGKDKLYLTTSLDNFSSFVKVFASTECPRSRDCANFLAEVVGEGQFTPSKICVDNGPQFTGSPFRQAVETLGAVLEYSGAYAHWAAGKIERWHRVLNERVRAAIHHYRWKLRRQYLLQGKGNVMVPVQVAEVIAMVNEVVSRWNVSPRSGGRPSPHDMVRPYPAWIYTEINAYRPLPINPIRLPAESQMLVPRGAPQVGELWRTVVHPGEHSVDQSLALAPKLKPNHAYARVTAQIGFGRYLVLMDGASRPVPKERRDLVSRVEDETPEAALLPQLSVVDPPAVSEQHRLVLPPEGQNVGADTGRRRTARARKLVVDRLRAEGFAAVAQPLLENHPDEDPISVSDQSSC